ncbi:hypothetical protein QAD02_024385 [Eretmocerus hayati]|uniref:Uncharacterized protein n=1 Tax=Eretmocerus hayati TaxID=131215 RepID=A0ACC2Q3E6_9HYME|nr:hypothetical protein QAD02_024385 [Eretmocerus hayati]
MKKNKKNESKLDKNNDSESVVSEDTLDDFTGGSNFYLEDGEFNDECGEEECDDWNMLHHSYSQAFKINLPGSIKYAIRSGTLHMGMDRFCERGRGYQGPGIGIAAIVTSHVEEAPRWDEFTVDQVVKDGDRYCIASAKEKSIEDPSLITVEHMSRRIDIRNRYRGYLDIGEPQYIGQFRSEDSRILHVAKALELFFSTYDAGVMTSKVLNIGIWRSSGYYNIFDGQARLDNCEIPKRPEDKGSAKLIILQNLMAVVFVILEKSNVKNEMFIMYPVSVLRISKFCEIDEKFEELEFGSKSKQLFQSIVRSTYHLHHTLLPVEFHGRGQLPLAMTAIIYSKFVPSANWSSLLVDLIFNQSSVYLTELSRLLEKPLESDFELSVKEIPEDVVIGVYRSKIKIAENAVPGETKEKLSLQDGVREFFSKNSVGIIELDNMFYAMWRDNKKYYLFNPLACDEKGVRVDSSDPESKHKYDEATACVTMSSCPLELLDLLLGDAEEEPVDTYAIHGIDVIYVKSGLMEDGSDEEVLYQKCKKDKGRSEKPADKCVRKVDSLPRAKKEEELFVDEIGQYPELMDDVENFVGSFDEIQEGDAKASEEDEKLSRCIDFDVNDIKKCRMFYNSRYKIVNPHRLRLKATKSCASKEFLDRSRGRQGLIAALGAMAQSQMSHIEKWTSSELDRIIESANDAYELLVAWILAGSEGDFDISDDAEMEPADKAADAVSQKLKRSGKGLEHMDLSMLPPAMKIGDAKFSVVSKMNVLEGDANPMANLGEALEKYFHHFDEMILENKRLFYGVWKSGDKYFVLNPYGSDKDGWRNQAYPAQLCVTDCLNELVNLLYGILEFNEYHFVLHFVKLAVAVAVEGEEEGQAELPEVQLPEIEIFERFKTQFLPVTDEDYIEVTAEKQEEETQSEDLSEQQDDVQDKVSVKTGISKVTWRDEELKLTNLFEESPEPEPQKTPKRLNFSLVTGLIKVQMTEDQEKNDQRIEIYYEQLKYKHPPPFILPDKQNICNLLDNKKVTESVPSLVSRFSIDSKLIVKPKIDSASPDDEATISLLGLHERSKLITIPRHKYFLSISLPSGYTPIRAINEKFIRDKSEEEKAEEECKKKGPQKEKLEEVSAPDEKPILPKIIPLGPCISTPKPKLVPKDCPDKEDGCPLTKCEREDEILNKLVCSTENLLFEMMIPDFQDPKDALKDKQEPCCPSDEEDADDECGCTGPVCKEPPIPPNKPSKSPCNECGFVRTSSDNIGIILGQCCLEPRVTTEPCHYKPCFYASMLCVLAKVCVDAHEWSPQVIDRIVAAARKISTGTGRLRYKQSRRFRNVDILGARCDVTLRQVRYADPERYEPDCLRAVLDCFLTKDQTGIVVFANAAFAFWMTGEVYYLFDGYGCDADGRAMEAEGGACLMEICDFDTLVQRIEENTGEPFGKAYRYAKL